MLRTRPPHVTLLLTLAATAATLAAQGAPIGFEETFALAPDRAAAVATLIPGTDDWYYWHCRERLAARDFATVRRVVPTWVARHGHGPRVEEILRRDALLSFDDGREATFEFLRQRLGYTFHAQPDAPGVRTDVPMQLDPELLSHRALTARALARHGNTVAGFRDRALPALAATQLDDDTLRSLLQKLRRPDIANLPALVVRDLAHRASQGFGSLRIHAELRLEQLEECARLLPELLRQPKFVEAWLVRLRPSADHDVEREPGARTEYLERLWQFAQRLPSQFNSLKAHVLAAWLRHDLTQGAPDKERFLAYLRLPRRGGHVAPTHLERFSRSDEHVDAAIDFPTGLGAIGDDSALVRACLEHFFATEDTFEVYAEWLDGNWLQTVLAETKLLLGQGDPERWYSLLANPARLEELRQRVEIRFPPTMREHFAAGDDVRLEVDVKNVSTLLVKVFAIDAFRYHVEKQKPVDASIELDGIVANFEQTHAYAEPALRRVRRTFDLPMLKEPVTWVVELVGNGISSRAVIHKGSLRAVERTAAAGQLFTVFDEQGRRVRDAVAWFGGREYAADERGEILLPFSTEPGSRRLVLRAGNRSNVVDFAHRGEGYTLTMPAHVERGALVAGQRARVLLRPQLRLAQHDVSLGLLTAPVLTVVATDVDGTRTVQEVRPELVDERELVHELTVPERLRTLELTLRGTVKDLAGNDVELAAPAATFAVNGMDETTATGAAMLVPTRDGFVLDVRGKDGEPKVDRVLQVALHHHDFTDPVTATLRTDAAGRIALGALRGIERVDVDFDDCRGSFPLPASRCAWPDVLHGRAGEVLRLPHRGRAAAPERAELSLLGERHDAFARLAIADGFVELRALEPGDYELHDHVEGDTVQVRITRGERDGDWLAGAGRVLEGSTPTPLRLAAPELTATELVAHVANASPSTRLHVFASRHAATFDSFALARAIVVAPRWLAAKPAASGYHNGRRLGDEYRYVLERRFAAKYAGNMLARPSLLLNPWAIDDSTNEAPATAFDSNQWNSAVGLGGGAGGKKGGGGRAIASSGGHFANLDYLPAGSVVVANLVPARDGTVRVALADLGDNHVLTVLALDGEQAQQHVVVRDEQPLVPRRRRLPEALDATLHLTESARIDFVAADATTRLADARGAQVEVLDTLGDAHRLLAAISRDADLARFAFVLDWPQKKPEEKADLYRRHACHELHFFLHEKDRAFFDAVVRPFVAQKLDKTFLDHWLLGDDLARFVQPWQFAQLNLIERVLLAQRLDATGKQAIARSVREALELRPVDPRRLADLIATALSLDAMADAGDGRVELGLKAEMAAEPGLSPPKPGEVPPPPPLAAADRGEGKAKAEAEDVKLDEVAAPTQDKESAFDSNQWNSAVGQERKQEEARRRGDARQLFRAVDRTKLLVEHNWWHRRMEQTTPDVVAPNRFWVDYAAAPADAPFVSAALVEASNSFLEMMMALAVLDLPFVAGKHEITADGDARTLKAASPLLLVRKEVTRSERAPEQAPLLLGQNLFRADDRYRVENGEQRDAFVTDELLVDVPYGCQVVVTNPTSSRRTAEVLLQIPAGAIPVQKGFWTKGIAVQLEPYATRTLEYFFYFPGPGSFAHYPAHAAEKGKLAANAEPRTLQVVAVPTKVDTSSWEHVSQQGSAAEVLTFLDTHNVQGLDLARIAWRMQDREVFTQVLARLRARHVYEHTLWSYAILHRDQQATREHLQHANEFVQQVGMAIDSPLLTIDPKERRVFQHLELDPLVHPRAHQLGRQRVIGNRALAAQYHGLMTLLGYHTRLDAEDWLAVTYYLALQDRIEEALGAFAKIDASRIESKIQYDYLAAWLCFFTGDAAKARTLATAHRDEPVLHWQQRFRDVLAHLDEAEGKVATPSGEPGADLAATAPSLELGLTDTTIALAYKNLATCEVRYYELDVEFAFSAQPFASAGGASAAFVRPNLIEQKALPAADSQLAFALPPQFHQKNVLVEVRGGGLVRSKQYFANALAVRFLESHGQIAVSAPDTSAPLPKTYVKVFARLPDGTVRFHKDGYTDLRGRFDYASLSDDPNASAQRYAVLVLDEQRGAVIREVDPPTK